MMKVIDAFSYIIVYMLLHMSVKNLSGIAEFMTSLAILGIFAFWHFADGRRSMRNTETAKASREKC